MLYFYLNLLDTDEEKSKFEKLYYEYRKLMKRVALDILQDEPLAEDAVHDAFIKLTRHLDKIEDISCHKTKGLIVIIIRSVSLDTFNKRNKEETITVSDNNYNLIADDFSLEKYELEAIAQNIEKLPEIYSQVLMLKYLYDYDYREISKILNISEGTARKRLERGRKTLVTLLQKDEVTI